MPYKCTYIPNRSKKRPWTAKAVGRCACYARAESPLEDTWREIKEEARRRSCLSPDVNCDCEQVNAIITAMLESMAYAVVAVEVVVAVLLAIPVTRTLLTIVRMLYGSVAAGSLEQLPQMVEQIKQIGDVQAPYLEMKFDPDAGMWVNVPKVDVPIIIKP